MQCISQCNQGRMPCPTPHACQLHEDGEPPLTHLEAALLVLLYAMSAGIVIYLVVSIVGALV